MAIDTSSKQRLRTVVSRQTVQIDPSGREVLTVDGSGDVSAAINASKITMWADVAFRINIGDNTVTADANAPLFPANTLMTIDWNAGDYLATFWDGSNAGILYVVGVY